MTHVTRSDPDLRDYRVAGGPVTPDDHVVAPTLDELEPRVLTQRQPVVGFLRNDEELDPVLIELIVNRSGVGVGQARQTSAHQSDLGVLEIGKNDLEIDALPEPVLHRSR